MAYKIAVASTDGKFINEHFGRANQFLIFEADEGEFTFLELVKVQPFCQDGEHDDNRLLLAKELLLGCRAVLVSQIGKGATEALRLQKIEPLEVRDFIEDALPKLIKYYAKIDEGK